MANGSKKDGFIVGTFGQTRPDRPVPESLDGSRLWYSPSRDLFVITDQSNRPHDKSFKMDRFKRFYDDGVIVFAQPGTEDYMLGLLEQWEARNPPAAVAYDDTGAQAAPVAPMYDDLDGYLDGSNDFSAPTTPMPVRRTNRRDESIRGAADESQASQKDPTRRIPAIMALTLIIAIIIVVILNFGRPIMQSIAPLIS